MTWADTWPLLAGGAAIGAAVALLLLANQQIAGISGIAARLLARDSGTAHWRAAFLAGLLLPALWLATQSPLPETAPWPVLALAGLLVGLGTRVGGGCTSGHGVCGIANLSPRSLLATLLFMGAAGVTVYLVRHGGAP